MANALATTAEAVINPVGTAAKAIGLPGAPSLPSSDTLPWKTAGQLPNTPMPSAPDAMRFPLTPGALTNLPTPQDTGTKPTGVASSTTADQTLDTQKQGTTGLDQSVQDQQNRKIAAQANPKVSIVNLLNSKGMPSDYASRAQMAQTAGIQNYVGSADQNAQLIGWFNSTGGQPTTGSTGPTTSTSTGGIPNVTTGSPGDQYNQEISDTQKQIGQNYDDFKTKTDQIINGTFPLSPAQQATLDATQAKFDAVAKQQFIANQSYEQSVALAGNRLGLNIQNPQEYLAEQQKAISDDLDKVNNLDATAAKTLADLKQGFLDKDYTYINDQYNALQKTLEDKNNTLLQVQKRVDDMYTSTRDYNEKLAELDEKKREFNIQQAAASGAGSTTVPQVAMTSNGTPSASGQAAFLAALPADLATTIKAIAEYRQNPSSIPSKQYKGAGLLNQQQILSLVEQYDPTYNQAQYATRQATLTNFATGKYSQNVNALKTAVGHISDLVTNFGKLNNTSFTPYNWAKNNIEKGLGAGNIASTQENISAVSAELAGIFKSSGATDSEISAWQDNLSPNMSPEQSKAWIEQGLNLMGSRLSALQDTYTSAMGQPKKNGFLSDDNAAALLGLKAQGYNFNMPELADNPLVKIQAFHNSSPESAAILDQFHSIAPNATPEDIMDALAQNGIDLN